MSRNGYGGPKLPKVLLDQVHSGAGRGRRPDVSRKDRRKAERQEKKSHVSLATPEHNGPPTRLDLARQRHETFHDDSDEEKPPPPSRAPKATTKDDRSLKSILKKAPSPPLIESEDDSEESQDSSGPTISREGAKRKLADDDAEIAALEKKLGVKGKRSKTSKADDLDWLLGGSDEESDDAFGRSSKRKRPDDAKWLRDKRLKASGELSARVAAKGANGAAAASYPTQSDEDSADMSDELSDENSSTDDDEGENDGFEGFDSENGEENDDEDAITTENVKRPRENPYVAPVSSTTPKYVPPSLRKPATSDEESLRQLRRQLQGLLNRLSEANMLSILKSIDEVYSKNARQHVTSTIVDLLIGLVTDPSALNDTFLILHTGFATALYKVTGTDFGAYLLEKLVETFDHHRSRKTNGKQTLNLLAFLCNTYNFQLVGSSLIFDYIRLLLEELSEDNTELLLRVIRTSGQQLRVDDPSSLKDIVLLLQRSVATAEQGSLSVRTKFMIETINDLKNNRMKTGVATSAIVSEHTNRMKKALSALGNSRPIRASEPLRISLSDIRDSEKKGKWWLVGASYLDPQKHQQSNSSTRNVPTNEDAGYESETPGTVNLQRLARSQGMNTDVRRAIFTTTLSSSDYKEAHMRILKLHLKPKQQPEISRVLVHCAGIEKAYNPFYALVARQFCLEHKMRKAFEFTLWDAFKEMDVGADDEEGMETYKVLNLAKFYGNLVANRAVDVRILKKLQMASLTALQSMFVEMFVTTVLVSTRKNRSDAMDHEGLVKDVFARAAGVEGLPQGLMLFIEQVVSKAEFASGKPEQKAVRVGCEFAVKALTEAASKATVVEDSEEEDH